MRKLLISAVFGTWGEAQETPILSGPTWLNLRSVGAGTAIEKREQHDSKCIQIVMVDQSDLLFINWSENSIHE